MTIYLFLQISLILCLCIYLSICDLKYNLIPVIPIYLAIGLAFLIQIIFSPFGLCDLLWNFLSGILNLIIFYFIRIISSKKLGLGDVIFSFFCGFMVKPEFLWVEQCVAVLLGFVVMIIISKKNSRHKFPFIPFMSAGLIIAYFLSASKALFQYRGH